MEPYRLEIAVRRIHSLVPLVASISSKITVEVRFLDFPSVKIQPQGYAAGDTVTYNVCHKAEFRMSAEQATAAFPAVCQCQLLLEDDRPVAAGARWSSSCVLLSDQSAQQCARGYVDYAILNNEGGTVGYAEMNCRVLSLNVPQPAPKTPPKVSAPASPPAPSVSMPCTPSARTLPFTAPTSTALARDATAAVDQGKPYIVRVVVGESDGHHRSMQPGRGSLQGPARQQKSTVAHGGGDDDEHRPTSLPVTASTVNTAERGSLLHLLQFDVAYQLQSLSETVAAALSREHDVLTRTPLKRCGETVTMSASKMAKSIDHHVAAIVRLANIVLQIANQLQDGSPAPARAGANREVEEFARQKRNPVNKLPTPTEGSVGHFLQYEVLYQLQCLGTNLSYATLAYRTALDTPLSSLPAQHVEFCTELEHHIQRLTKEINIMVQSSVDGTLGMTAESSSSTVAAVRVQHRARRSRQRSSPPTVMSKSPPTRKMSPSSSSSVDDMRPYRSSPFEGSSRSSNRSSGSSSWSSSPTHSRALTLPRQATAAAPLATRASPRSLPGLPVQPPRAAAVETERAAPSPLARSPVTAAVGQGFVFPPPSPKSTTPPHVAPPAVTESFGAPGTAPAPQMAQPAPIPLPPPIAPAAPTTAPSFAARSPEHPTLVPRPFVATASPSPLTVHPVLITPQPAQPQQRQAPIPLPAPVPAPH